jgi:hypothetical protein
VFLSCGAARIHEKFKDYDKNRLPENNDAIEKKDSLYIDIDRKCWQPHKEYWHVPRLKEGGGHLGHMTPPNHIN